MKSQPLKSFRSVAEATELINSFHSRFRHPTVSKTKNEIATNLISGNIARSFSGLPDRPSRLVANWGVTIVDVFLADLNSLTDQNEYDSLIQRFAINLINFWDDAVKNPSKRIGWGPASKITNLFVKALNQSGHIKNGDIYKFMHVPFDLYTLQPIRSIINDLTQVKYGINIPHNPTMKFVDTPALYEILQDSIRELCLNAKSYPIVYEYLCWDEQH